MAGPWRAPTPAPGRNLPRLDAAIGKQTYSDLRLPDGHHGRAVAEAFPVPAVDARGKLIVVTAEETGNLERLENRIHVTLLLGAVATIVAMFLIATARGPARTAPRR